MDTIILELFGVIVELLILSPRLNDIVQVSVSVSLLFLVVSVT